ncbi:hypothetical protein F511_46028 [Dorcoceras hygrometricum]|uniref:Uncharacterized protein n=1 Tax=Dorcoceras hygrometricum TaxID=472368 RepID=A0A2Z6ZUK4_9LAMI|nr:hypothetical protein F511_46028 [Dorcoceras hygrometricum]
MPPRRTTNRQTEHGSTSTDVLNVAATPMETLLKRFQSFKPPTLTGTESAIDCENWLRDIQQLFEALDYTDDCRVKLKLSEIVCYSLRVMKWKLIVLCLGYLILIVSLA